jgi:hypothetical protein
MAVQTVAMIPALGVLFEGLVWDITTRQDDEISSDISQEPIEDPNRSYLIDFNQDTAAKLNLTIEVSANSCGTASNFVGSALGVIGTAAQLAKLNACYDALLVLKRRQTTKPDALIDVYTGSHFFRNMAIIRIGSSRDAERPNVLIIDLELMEFRFAQAPKMPTTKTPLKASSGSVDSANQRVNSEADRALLEATRQARQAQIVSYAGQAIGFLRGATGL